MRSAAKRMARPPDANWALRALFLLALLAFGEGPWSPCLAGQSSDPAQEIQQLLQSGDTSTAQTLLSEALKGSPNRAGLHNLQGVLDAQKGDVVSAEAEFKEAMALDPHLDGAYLNLGHLYQEQTPKDPAARDKALDAYAALLRFAPDHPEGNYQSAVLLMQKGLYAASLHHLSKLPAEMRNLPQVLSAECGDYAGLGQRDKAERAAEQMLKSPNLAEPDVTSILPILASQKDTSLPLQLLQGIATRQLASFESLHTLGLLYMKTGQLAEARRTLEAAAQLQPGSVSNLLDLARVANDQKDYTGALGYLAHARELEPGNASIHFFWGIVCIEQNLAEEAYQALKKAVALNPENAYYNYALGAVAMQRQDASESIPYLKKYCESKPHDPRGRLALGAAYFYSRDDDSAEKVLSTVAHGSPTAAEANFYLGRIANRHGEYPEAIRYLGLALQARPDYADAYAELGLVHLKQKEYGPAENELEKAIRLRPDSYAANLNLMILYQRTKNPKADEQVKKFSQVKEEREELGKEFLRTIEVRPN